MKTSGCNARKNKLGYALLWTNALAAILCHALLITRQCQLSNSKFLFPPANCDSGGILF